MAFAVTFVYVGVVWLNHHALFARIRNVALGLNWGWVAQARKPSLDAEADGLLGLAL